MQAGFGPSTGCWAERFATVRIVRLLSKPFTGEVVEEHAYYPTTYLSGVHETLALTLLVARLLPLLVPDYQLNEFDYMTMVCIGSVAMFMTSFNVGLAWRYWWLRGVRSYLMAEPRTWASGFNRFATLVFAISTNVCLCMWLIPNESSPIEQAVDDVIPLRALGRGIISCYALTVYGAYLGNLLEIRNGPRSDNVKRAHKAFAIVYGLCVIYLLSEYSYLLLAHRRQNSWHVNAAGWPTQMVLIGWMACLASVDSFMPLEPSLVMITDLGRREDVESVAVVDEPQICRCCEWFKQFSDIAKLLSQRLDTRIFYPKDYLGASHEVVAYTLIITWILTMSVPAFRPQIVAHPARAIIGSFNPCFGWDYAPASWISVSLCSFNVYFSYRYAWLKMLRKQLLKEPKTLATKFNTFATYALGLSSNLWLCLWIIGPNPKDPVGADTDGPEIFWWSLHTGIFVFYATSKYNAYLGNMLEILLGPQGAAVERKHKVFAIVYGLSVGYLLVVYGLSLASHEPGEGPGLGSSHFTQVADIVWIACVISVRNFLPREPPLRTQTTVSQITVPQC